MCLHMLAIDEKYSGNVSKIADILQLGKFQVLWWYDVDTLSERDESLSIRPVVQINGLGRRNLFLSQLLWKPIVKYKYSCTTTVS